MENKAKSSTKKNFKPAFMRLLLLVIVGAVSLLILGLIFRFISNAGDNNVQTVIAPRRVPGIVLNALTAKSIDASGKAVTASSTFTSTDKDLFLVVELNNAKAGTKIAYVRLLNGRRLDQKSVTINNDNTKYINFDWGLKDQSSPRPVGQYRVKIYTNGIYERDVNYSIVQ